MVKVFVPGFQDGFPEDTLIVVTDEKEKKIPVSLPQLLICFRQICTAEMLRQGCIHGESNSDKEDIQEARQVLEDLPPLIPIPSLSWWKTIDEMYPQIFEQLKNQRGMEMIIRRNEAGLTEFLIPFTQRNGFTGEVTFPTEELPLGFTLEIFKEGLECALRLEVIPQIETMSGENWFREMENLENFPLSQKNALEN